MALDDTIKFWDKLSSKSLIEAERLWGRVDYANVEEAMNLYYNN